MTFKKSLIALVGASFVLATPVAFATIDGAIAKTTMMKKKQPPRAHDNKQTKTGGQPGGSAAKN